MNRMLGAVVVFLCVGIVAAIVLGGPASVPPTINFIGFRETSAGRVAVFRATNASSRAVAYWGKSASEPSLWYVVSDGKQWKTHGRRSVRPYCAGTFTLKPRSSMDFAVEAPTAATTTPTSLGWGPDVPHPTSSELPANTETFGIVIAFKPGDAAALARGDRPIHERLRTALWNATWYVYSSGWIQETTRARIGKWLAHTPDVLWVESNPATP